MIKTIENNGNLTNLSFQYPLPIPKKTITPVVAAAPSEDKEDARIRKENLLLKNSVLRKKERLLELQISLAERTLRRHQLQ
jgi:hypothetical protein